MPEDEVIPPAAAGAEVRALRRGRRAQGVLVASACLALLVVAAWLDPSPAGHGTHEALGLPACGWVARFDRPCATCGMTTSFAWFAEGNPVRAFQTQPAGASLALVTASLAWAGLHQAVSGARILNLFGVVLRARWLVVWGVVFLGAWGYKLLTWG